MAVRAELPGQRWGGAFYQLIFRPNEKDLKSLSVGGLCGQVCIHSEMIQSIPVTLLTQRFVSKTGKCD